MRRKEEVEALLAGYRLSIDNLRERLALQRALYNKEDPTTAQAITATLFCEQLAKWFIGEHNAVVDNIVKLGTGEKSIENKGRD